MEKRMGWCGCYANLRGNGQGVAGSDGVRMGRCGCYDKLRRSGQGAAMMMDKGWRND